MYFELAIAVWRAKKKAMRVLGILQRSLSSCGRYVKERSYLSLVRPIVEYATVAWFPQTKKGIDCIESVQRRAARLINNDCSCYSSVSTMVTDFNWPSLQSRRRIFYLGMFYKISRGNIWSQQTEVFPGHRIVALTAVRATI